MITFYDCATAPSPRRARMILAEKRVDVQRVEIDLRNGEQFSETFRAVNPACTVPVLVTPGGEALCDNASIARWLEEVYPDPPLMGVDPLDRARVAEWLWRAEFEGLMAIMEVLRNSSKAMAGRALPGPHAVEQIPELAERGRARAQRFLDVLEARLADTPWLAGDTFSVADIAAFVFVEFAGWVKIAPGAEHGALASWLEAVRARPSASA
ncbi:glutathione S-transferase [Glycocaulis albus]|uniref:Glutathione S-transferase n=1 Tax=Glycocaulis albus TaxID=1382801 RepID=A0ABQ1XQ70_9PROT|nr:glutathione S-transferase family protein [Glycocaulis albus]MBV5257421.1 glutathione S-transferase family protein [Synechococcus moorigangaii CMS01]GGH00218.1 glutathione S-transferase [Glycocaulis albus]